MSDATRESLRHVMLAFNRVIDTAQQVIAYDNLSGKDVDESVVSGTIPAAPAGEADATQRNETPTG